MATNLLVRGLSADTTDITIREKFSQFGQVTDIELTPSKKPNMQNAKVEMTSSSDALRAMMGLHTKDIDGNRVRVVQAGLSKR